MQDPIREIVQAWDLKARLNNNPSVLLDKSEQQQKANDVSEYRKVLLKEMVSRDYFLKKVYKFLSVYFPYERWFLNILYMNAIEKYTQVTVILRMHPLSPSTGIVWKHLRTHFSSVIARLFSSVHIIFTGPP